MPNAVYRTGDVVRFRRGSNEYTGKIYKLSKVMHGCIVQVTDGPERAQGAWTVALKSITQIVVPVLTEKETVALIELARESRPVALAVLNGVRRAGGDPLISGTTLHGLARRGFAVGERTGVTGSGPMQWRASAEGHRVARSL